jgi:hypothetical protein
VKYRAAEASARAGVLPAGPARSGPPPLPENSAHPSLPAACVIFNIMAKGFAM